MSLLSNLFSSLTGSDSSSEHPCSNCESDCAVCPKACEKCKPLKEQLVDAIYNVEHIEEFRDRYEVVTAATASVGTTVCPYCGGPASSSVCEYCGMQISEGTGKIQVTSANDIPNPILEAQNIIFNRRKIISEYDGSASSSGILSTIISAVTGGDDEDSVLGSKMTEAEIEAMADKYSVSVADYLTGLDVGTYLSKSAYEKKQTQTTSAVTAAGTAAGAIGVAGIAGSILSGGTGHSYQQAPPQPKPAYNNQINQSRPPVNSGNNRPEGQRPSNANVSHQQSGNRPQSVNQGHQNHPQSVNQGHQNRPGTTMGHNTASKPSVKKQSGRPGEFNGKGSGKR